MTILLTGVAGFIGMHTAQVLLARGNRVIGVDNCNDYYDPALKQARLQALQQGTNGHLLTFHQVNIADREAMQRVVDGQPITHIIHLAAQAGVRYSLQNPFAYVESNLMGQMVLLEIARARMPELQHMVYASSSSVYGGNTKIPFSVEDRTDAPISLYAATKKADEALSYSYAHLYNIPLIGLRFFTVYGPWGRPDMAYFHFTRDILAGTPIRVFNHGDVQRDFTYVDDIVAGILGAMELSAPRVQPPHRVYNLGHHQPHNVLEMIHTLEGLLGKKAVLELLPMQPGDMQTTYADITESTRDFGFTPRTSLADGLAQFVNWYKAYYA